jgi:RNA polymerase sigma-70 factor (ECF subfamily)
MDKQQENDLLRALKSGDFDAFNILYEKHHRQLYAFALKLSKNIHEAEEIVQSVFVSIWENRALIDPQKSFHNYLFRIAQNRFYDIMRKRLLNDCYLDYVKQYEESVVDDIIVNIENAEIREILQQLLLQVPERRRLIFELNRFQGLSYKQIAEQLQISENTVDSQIRHVLNFLRKELPKRLISLFF